MNLVAPIGIAVLLYYAPWEAWLVLAPLFALCVWALFTDDGRTDPSHEIGQD